MTTRIILRVTKIVLAHSHSRSLELLCTAGGGEVKLDARSEFKMLPEGMKLYPVFNAT